MTDDWAAQKAREIMEEYRHRRILSDMPAQIWLSDAIAAALREVEARTSKRSAEIAVSVACQYQMKHTGYIAGLTIESEIRAAFPTSQEEPK